MSDLLQRGQQWLADQFSRHASREVIYRRGDQETSLLATIGKTVAQQDTGDGLVLAVEIRDYLIDTAELRLDGELALPQRGDQIIEFVDGQTFVYEVLPIGDQRAWRYSDPFRHKLRIHTRLVDHEV